MSETKKFTEKKDKDSNYYRKERSEKLGWRTESCELQNSRLIGFQSKKEANECWQQKQRQHCNKLCYSGPSRVQC